MPRIKRWFRVSHDLLDDPETIELANLFGDKAIFMWLRMLSWADRNEGVLGNANQITRGFGKCLDSSHPNLAATKAEKILSWMIDKSWVELRLGRTSGEPQANLPRTSGEPQANLRLMSVTKWSKYNITRETAKSPPNHPNHLLLKKEEDTTEKWPSPRLLIEKYNREAPDELSAVEKITPARIRKARDYLKIFPDEQFWTEVFAQLHQSLFLRGIERSNGHQSFKASFDWLLTKGHDGTENAAKVWEAKYNDKNSR